MNRITCPRLPGAVVALMLAVATVVVAQKIEVRVQHDKSFKFAGLKTWNWHPDGAGDVKMLTRAGEDPAPIKARFEPVILDAVEKELGARALTRRTDGPADLLVNYYVLVMPATNSTQLGHFLPSVAEYGLPPFTTPTTRMKAFEQGTLVLDFVAPALKAVVWRGIAETEARRDFTPEQRRVRIEKGVHEILKKLPKK
jgi:hypothetical protein